MYLLSNWQIAYNTCACFGISILKMSEIRNWIMHKQQTVLPHYNNKIVNMRSAIQNSFYNTTISGCCTKVPCSTWYLSAPCPSWSGTRSWWSRLYYNRMVVSLVTCEIVHSTLLKGETVVSTSLQSTWIEQYVFQQFSATGHISVLIIYEKRKHKRKWWKRHSQQSLKYSQLSSELYTKGISCT
jgi:hypothetical protein